MPPSDQQPKTPAATAAGGDTPRRRRGWRVFFSVFKWCRIAVLLALLSVIVLGLFLNRAGIPEWATRRVVAQLRTRGWEIEFSRMRLRWYRGIVADDLQLRRADSRFGPHIFVEMAEFRLNRQALRHFDLQADSVMAAGGRLLWPLPGTNHPKQTLMLNRLHGELLFKPDDQWELRSLEGTLLGTEVRIRGDVTNASLIRDWKLPETRRRRPGEEPAEFWRKFFTEADRVRVAKPTEVAVIFALDARDVRTLEASVKLMTAGLDSPWAGGTNVQLTARLLPGEELRAELAVHAERAHSRWAAGTNLQLTLQITPSLTHWLPTNATATVELGDAQTPWGRAARARLQVECVPAPTNAAFRATRFHLTTAQARTEWGDAAGAELELLAQHPATHLLPAFIKTDVQLTGARTRWATSDWTRVSARLPLPAATNLLLFATNRSWQARLENIPLEAITTVSNFHAARLDLSFATLSNHWQSPQWAATLAAHSGASDVDISASVNATNRDLEFTTVTRLDARQVAPWFGTNAPRWFSDIDWRSPLKVEATGRTRLPTWTNRAPDWRGEVLPATSVAGRFDLAGGGYRGIHLDRAGGLVRLTNLVWTVPELTLARPEGTLAGAYSGDQRTGAFQARLRSDLDLMALRPLFPEEEAGVVFAMFEFSAPPLLTAEASGNWNDFARFGVAGTVAVTNVVFRDQAVSYCATAVAYTNQFLSIYRPLVLREGGERATADGLGIDLARERLYLTNATGNLPPMVVAKAIGNHIVERIEAYLFDLPPALRVEGEVPLRKEDRTARMRFDVDGGRFHWRTFHLERAKAQLLWEGPFLTLTNLQGRWHGGDAQGWAYFDFRAPRGGAFQMYGKVDGSDLKAVVNDLQTGKTNRIEGTFGGELVVTQAFCDDLASWFGHGHAYLRDGLLWDIPIFGVFSPVLNAVVPGLGNSRAKQGSATFQITNSIFHSKDAEISATAMRMQYQGTLDFDTRVDLRMEAELFRDMPGLGLIVSKVLWPVTKLFEYRVTGSLDNPKTTPMWGVPRVILFPLQPVKTIKEIFGIGERKPDEKSPRDPPATREPKPDPAK